MHYSNKITHICDFVMEKLDYYLRKVYNMVTKKLQKIKLFTKLCQDYELMLMV